MFSDTAKTPVFSDAAALGDARKKKIPRHSHSHDKSVFSDTARKSTFGGVVSFSDVKKRRAPRNSHSHDKSVFSDTAKKSAFSDAAVFRDVQKKYSSRHSHSHDKSVFMQRVRTLGVREREGTSRLLFGQNRPEVFQRCPQMKWVDRRQDDKVEV